MTPLRHGLRTDRTGCYRPHLLQLPLFGLLLSGCVTAPSQADANRLFKQYEVVTGPARHQTVLTGFFLGSDTAELAVVHIDENNDRRLTMFGLDGGAWVSVLDATLGPDVLFVDVANIGGRDRLITYKRGRMHWFDPNTTTQPALVDIETSFNAADDDEVPHLDITRDLNGDGREDLLLPDIGGFWISVQLRDGTFADAMHFGPPEPFRDEVGLTEPGFDKSKTYGESGITAFTLPLYLGRVHQADYNHDGLSDLVFWNADHFDVYLQNSRGLFDPAIKSFPVGVPFDSDGAYSRSFDFSNEGAFSTLFGFNENTSRTVLHSLRDLNGDGVADLVTVTLSGRSLVKQRSVYEVHFGTPTANGIVFSRNISTEIRRRGKGGGMQPWGYSSQLFQDFDGDDRVDIMFRDTRIGIGGMSRALVGKSVPIDLEFYRIEDGIFANKPNTTRKIRPGFNPSSRGVFLPAVLIGDVNGDGRSDLLAGKSQEELNVYVGIPGPELFARQPQTLAVTLPNDERNTWLVDLNKDGKQDLLMHHPSTTEPHRLITLIAR